MTDRLELDYEQTSEMFKLLADIRFKLLALVPAVAGVGTALVGDGGMDAEVQLALGLLGFMATLGILLYELRNSELYNWAIHRAKHLERELGLSPSALGVQQGGIFGERVPPHRRLLGMRIKHDEALGLVYGSALGAWTWVALRGLVTLVTEWSNRAVFWVAFGGAVATGSLVAWQVFRHDRRQRMPKAVTDSDHFRKALEEVRLDLDRMARNDADHVTRALEAVTLPNSLARRLEKQRRDRKAEWERELGQLSDRCARILDRGIFTRHNDLAALGTELDELEAVLAILETSSTSGTRERCRRTKDRCRQLREELGIAAGQVTNG